MRAHRKAPQSRPGAARLSRLLSYKHIVGVSPLESTLLQLFILNNLNSFRINTYAKTRRGGPTPNSAFRPSFTPKGTVEAQEEGDAALQGLLPTKRRLWSQVLLRRRPSQRLLWRRLWLASRG